MDTNTSSIPKVKIVLVEDDAVLQRMFQEKLEQQGFEVITAGNGNEGFEQIVAHKPAIVLSDIMMPGSSGLELLQQKQAADAEVQAIPVIVLTNLDDEAVKAEALALGAVDFVAKETEPTQIVHKLMEYLGTATPNSTATIIPLDADKSEEESLEQAA